MLVGSDDTGVQNCRCRRPDHVAAAAGAEDADGSTCIHARHVMYRRSERTTAQHMATVEVTGGATCAHCCHCTE